MLVVIHSIDNCGVRGRKNVQGADAADRAIAIASDMIDEGAIYVHAFQTAKTRDEYVTLVEMDNRQVVD